MSDHATMCTYDAILRISLPAILLNGAVLHTLHTSILHSPPPAASSITVIKRRRLAADPLLFARSCRASVQRCPDGSGWETWQRHAGSHGRDCGSFCYPMLGVQLLG